MGIISWIVFGLIAGAIAKALHPGRDPGGWIVTILIGIAGAIVGGLIGSAVVGRGITGFNLSSLLFAVGGGVLLLFIYRMVVSRRSGHKARPA